MNPITPALIREALQYIPAALPRDEWARLGMAIKSEFPDDTGLTLFDEWSQSAPESYSTSGVKECWRSIKAGGGVGIGTLLMQAKEHGFRRSDYEARTAPAAPAPSAAQVASHQQAKAEQRRKEQAETEAAQVAAKTEAQARWEAASGQGSSPYLERKGVAAYGLRFEADGTLLVPLHDAQGVLWNLQCILPRPLPDGLDKLFIKGSRKSGLWHWVAGAEGPDAGPAAVLAVGEGYATCASVHAATGWPVAVAFDAGNLRTVARALRQQYPAALIVVCGDDDLPTMQRTGQNPGRKAAEAAAQAVAGVALFPHSLPDGASDFNDMHLAVGLPGVANHLHTSLHSHHQALQATATAAPANAQGHTPAPATTPRPGRAKSIQSPAGAGGGRGGRAGAGGGDQHSPESLDPFTVDETGVWFQGRDSEGKPKPPEWVCSRLDVLALTKDMDGLSWGYLLAFCDSLGKPRQWAMPARMLATDGGEYRAMLLNMGLRIAPSPRARNLLTQYIQTREPGRYATCTDRIGWHGHAFVLPHQTIGTDDEGQQIVFQSDNAIENTFRVRGTPDEWRNRVAAWCEGNTRLVFAVCCAFAAPLMRPVGMESGGFHFRGDSSSGKTTALRVAGSVYGGRNYMQRWRTTDNALEAIAAQHCDGLLILDELAQVDPKVAGECAYMLANEQSKGRMGRNTITRSRLSWRLLFLSAGELGLADHMAEGQKRVRAGQEVRMTDIPADAGRGFGLFEELHGQPSGSDFARLLTTHAGETHGATGHAWLQWLVAHADTLKARVRAASTALTTQWMPAGASGQVERVCARFALVAAAGELATEAGLTGWPAGESTHACKTCFDAWIAARGGVGNSETTSMLRTVRNFLEQHGEGRFTWWHRAVDDHSSKTLHRVGFRRMVTEDGTPIKSDADHQKEYGDTISVRYQEGVHIEYFILPDAFRTEVCKGYDHKAVLDVLLQHGCLKPGKGRSHDTRQRLPGIGNSRCYQISPKLFDLDA